MNSDPVRSAESLWKNPMNKKHTEEYSKQKLKEMRTFEENLYNQGIYFVAGVDEVGRGPLAGPVVSAAVILPIDFDVLGIDDSKKLSEKKRDMFCPIIKEKALAYGIGMAGEKTIDSINILEATKLSMKEALKNAEIMLGEKVQHILFDAVKISEIETPQTSLIHGDSKSISIAAASIVAKVTRDAMMKSYHEQYPWYSFDRNKGYGTRAHYEGIKAHGICPIHRITFLKKIIATKQ